MAQKFSKIVCLAAGIVPPPVAANGAEKLVDNYMTSVTNKSRLGRTVQPIDALRLHKDDRLANDPLLPKDDPNKSATKKKPLAQDLRTSLTEEQRRCVNNLEDGLTGYKVSSDATAKYHKFTEVLAQADATLAVILQALAAYQESLLDGLFTIAEKAFTALPVVGDILKQLREIINIVCARFHPHVLKKLDNLKEVDKQAIQDQIKTQATAMVPAEVIREINELTTTAFNFIKNPPKAREEGLQPLTKEEKDKGRNELLEKITDPNQKTKAGILISDIERLADAMNTETDHSQREKATNEMLEKLQELAEAVAGKKMDAEEKKLPKVDQDEEKELWEVTVEALKGPCEKLAALLEQKESDGALEIRKLYLQGKKIVGLNLMWFPENKKNPVMPVDTSKKLLQWMQDEQKVDARLDAKVEDFIKDALKDKNSRLSKYIDKQRYSIEEAEGKKKKKKAENSQNPSCEIDDLDGC